MTRLESAQADVRQLCQPGMHALLDAAIEALVLAAARAERSRIAQKISRASGYYMARPEVIQIIREAP